MRSIPSISSQVDEKIIFKTIEKNFSKLAPYYYSFISNWLIRAYKHYHDIDKFIIVIYLINKDLIFFRRNGLIIDYDTFYKDKTVEIEKINITDISDKTVLHYFMQNNPVWHYRSPNKEEYEIAISDINKD